MFCGESQLLPQSRPDKGARRVLYPCRERPAWALGRGCGAEAGRVRGRGAEEGGRAVRGGGSRPRGLRVGRLRPKLRRLDPDLPLTGRPLPFDRSRAMEYMTEPVERSPGHM